ncbi:MAG: nucleotidyl transferase AbiEii/AbiGii toxin family protein [Cyclobacteriaceae bacterium]|nr:nucleotidyl transferase AbiEii/AbiGii toxin family protein [Cyclobacteriaceae bacterium]
MAVPEFAAFRLVGGTALSLQRGHRKSIDLDLFTDAEYGSLDFDALDRFLREHYKYVDSPSKGAVGMGMSYFVGTSDQDSIKLDIFYTDNFIQPYEERDGVRLATVEEIIAMKLEVISHGGRKKDFWDIHELQGDYAFKEMLALHEQRYPFGHNRDQITRNFTNFEMADDDLEPVCLRGHYWEMIKLDLVDFANSFQP